MDDFYCRYGFFTTHDHTWFVNRDSDNHFLVSKAIKANNKATEDALSLRECFLFFGHLAGEKSREEGLALYGKRTGDKLMSLSTK